MNGIPGAVPPGPLEGHTVAMSKPYTVVRTITVDAASEHVRALVNDVHEGLAKLKRAAESA